jgi:hypothetical protein
MVQRRAGRSEMALGQMQVDGSGLKVGMPEQRLHCRQIGSAFQKMLGETVLQQVRADGLGDARPLRRFPAGLP